MPRTGRKKSFQTIFVETVLFISLFAIVGHISLNFWERYVVQKELVHMKSSLYSLKDTINHIGVAYTQLYTELKTLADIAETDTANLKPEQHIQKSSNYKPDVAQGLLKDLQAHAIIDSGIADVVDEKKIIKNTQTAAIQVTQLHKLKALQEKVPHLKDDNTSKSETVIISQTKSKKSLQHEDDKSPQAAGDISLQTYGDKSPQIKEYQKNGTTASSSIQLPHYTDEAAQIHLKIEKNIKKMNVATTTKDPKDRASATDDIEAVSFKEISTRGNSKSKHKRENIHRCSVEEKRVFKKGPVIDFTKF